MDAASKVHADHVVIRAAVGTRSFQLSMLCSLQLPHWMRCSCILPSVQMAASYFGVHMAIPDMESGIESDVKIGWAAARGPIGLASLAA